MMKCPTDFHGFKLLRVIGSGCEHVRTRLVQLKVCQLTNSLVRVFAGYSDAYLAESPVKSGLPRLVCIKVATDKQDIHPLLYTDKSARGELVYQREILKPLMHPFVVKYFEDALPDVANAIVLEAGIVDLKRLQTVSSTVEFSLSSTVYSLMKPLVFGHDNESLPREPVPSHRRQILCSTDVLGCRIFA